MAKGDDPRAFIDQDLAIRDTLLQEKYDWVKTHLFGGQEFVNGGGSRGTL